MTLIVSLRIPDGIVIAGDSLATMAASLNVHHEFDIECPHCRKKHRAAADTPVSGVSSSTFSYAQKIVPFLRRYGVGTSGAGQLAGQSIYFILRQLETELLAQGTEDQPNGVSTVAAAIGARLVEMIDRQVQAEGKTLESQPNNWRPLVCQIVGYDDDNVPSTIEIEVGKNVKTTAHKQLGCTVSGQTDTVKALWAGGRSAPGGAPPFPVFSLQDGIDYADFLISTTAAQQKFSVMVPGVGGDIDIGLVTPFESFTWIRQKELSKTLAGGY